MNNLIQANEYLNKDFDTEINNMNKQIENINNNIDNDNAKPYTTSTETSCMDSLCCRICAEEPITYTSKNINGMENIDNILTNFKPLELKKETGLYHFSNYNNNINGSLLYEKKSLNNMNNESSEKQNRIFDSISKYSDK